MMIFKTDFNRFLKTWCSRLCIRASIPAVINPMRHNIFLTFTTAIQKTAAGLTDLRFKGHTLPKEIKLNASKSSLRTIERFCQLSSSGKWLLCLSYINLITVQLYSRHCNYHKKNREMCDTISYNNSAQNNVLHQLKMWKYHSEHHVHHQLADIFHSYVSWKCRILN